MVEEAETLTRVTVCLAQQWAAVLNPVVEQPIRIQRYDYPALCVQLTLDMRNTLLKPISNNMLPSDPANSSSFNCGRNAAILVHVAVQRAV